MGVTYEQRCILGICIDSDDCRTIKSEAVYEMQNRYDVKTGKVKGQEKVLIKEAEEEYTFGAVSEIDFWALYEELCEVYDDLDVRLNDDCIYIGRDIGDHEDTYGPSLLSGSVSLQKLADIAKDLPFDDVQLHFIDYYTG